MPELTHAQLVRAAARWLTRRMGCGAVVTEVGGNSLYGEIPDAIGWKHSQSTIVECKMSRADFLADRKKSFRIVPHHGMGQLRYYMTPKGLLKKEDVVPLGWGLLEYGEKRIQVVSPSQNFVKSLHAEQRLMYTALQRVQFRIGEVPLHEVVSWDARGKEVYIPDVDLDSKFEPI